jgi:hypothetical protein
MKCPECGSENIGVNNTMPDDETRIFRRRKCHDCGAGFRTVESIDDGSFQFNIGYSEAYKVKKRRRRTKCIDPAKPRELASTLDHK